MPERSVVLLSTDNRLPSTVCIPLRLRHLPYLRGGVFSIFHFQFSIFHSLSALSALSALFDRPHPPSAPSPNLGEGVHGAVYAIPTTPPILLLGEAAERNFDHPSLASPVVGEGLLGEELFLFAGNVFVTREVSEFSEFRE